MSKSLAPLVALADVHGINVVPQLKMLVHPTAQMFRVGLSTNTEDEIKTTHNRFFSTLSDFMTSFRATVSSTLDTVAATQRSSIYAAFDIVLGIVTLVITCYFASSTDEVMRLVAVFSASNISWLFKAIDYTVVSLFLKTTTSEKTAQAKNTKTNKDSRYRSLPKEQKTHVRDWFSDMSVKVAEALDASQENLKKASIIKSGITATGTLVGWVKQLYYNVYYFITGTFHPKDARGIINEFINKIGRAHV